MSCLDVTSYLWLVVVLVMHWQTPPLQSNLNADLMDRILCVLRTNDVHMQECKAGEGVPCYLWFTSGFSSVGVACFDKAYDKAF